MFYDKKIKYLNYLVGGERIKGCGFVKLEIREQNLNLEVVISGLPPSIRAHTDVWLCTGEATYSIGQVCLENGGGSFRLCNCNVAEISPTGVLYDDWKGIVVWPNEECEISACWEEVPRCQLERVEVSRELTGEVAVEQRMPERLEMVRAEVEKSEMPEVVKHDVPAVSEANSEALDILAVAGEEAVSTAQQDEQNIKRAERNVRSGAEARRFQSERQPEQMRMAEDKWEQLWEIYPHIKPFRDKREYLSIRPADFVLFSNESYKAVNNSFLLHGYHNYEHLILARTVKKGEVSYYIGTPGNFFQREKQVAVMFGFTGFECFRDPAREGDFGYYLMEVQL